MADAKVEGRGAMRVVVFRKYGRVFRHNTTPICPLCLQRKPEHLHEIVPRRVFPAKELPIWLCVPLCRTCNLNEGETPADSPAGRAKLVIAAAKVWGLPTVTKAVKSLRGRVPLGILRSMEDALDFIPTVEKEDANV